MNAPLQRTLLAASAVGVAVLAAFSIAEGSLLLPLLLAAAASLSVVAYLGWRVEAVVLATTLAVYLIGNRGIAQFTPFVDIPLFIGELCLGFGAIVLILRGAFERRLPFQTNGLSLVVLLWLALGTGRVLLDVRTFGILALRDFATVYYAGYFFLAQEVARVERSRRLVRHCLGASLFVLAPLFASWVYHPDFFDRFLTFRGVPLIYYKGDIVATMLGGGVFYFYQIAETACQRWAWGALAMNFLGALFPTTRAAMVAMTLVSVLHIGAKRVRFFGVIGTLLLIAGTASVGWGIVSNRPAHETLAYRTLEYALSIFDLHPFGSHRYESYDEGDAKGRPDDNNAFRLVWWKTIAQETMAEAPLFGMGFGADLAGGFLSAYGLAGQSDFSTRSPHSIVFTVFGRMGLAGMAVLLALLIAMAKQTSESLRQGRKMPGGGERLALYAFVWVVFISACFGVVLEGPMGAIPFWTILGLVSCEPGQTKKLADTAPLPAGSGRI